MAAILLLLLAVRAAHYFSYPGDCFQTDYFFCIDSDDFYPSGAEPGQGYCCLPGAEESVCNPAVMLCTEKDASEEWTPEQELQNRSIRRLFWTGLHREFTSLCEGQIDSHASENVNNMLLQRKEVTTKDYACEYHIKVADA
jgi:hypothetical protein